MKTFIFSDTGIREYDLLIVQANDIVEARKILLKTIEDQLENDPNSQRFLTYHRQELIRLLHTKPEIIEPNQGILLSHVNE